MTARPTPFALVFGELGPQRFPDIARALEDAGRSAADRDAFVLLAPVARLLEELAADDASADEIDAHLRLLHHCYRHWAAGGWIYHIGDGALRRATNGDRLSFRLPHPALYLQLPTGRVWRPGDPPEPLDGVFITLTAHPGEIAALGVFGMHRTRPGFSAVAVEGPAPHLDPGATRADGSPLFAPLLQGGEQAGLHSVATGAEMLLLIGRLLALIPATHEARATADRAERIVDVP